MKKNRFLTRYLFLFTYVFTFTERLFTPVLTNNKRQLLIPDESYAQNKFN